MKIVVRSFVVAMLLSGVVLASHSQQALATSSNHRLAVSHQTLGVGAPVPACVPGDPDGCGIGPNSKSR